MFTEPYPRKFHKPSFTDRPLNIVTTTVHSLSTSSAATSWPYAAVETYRDGDKPPLLHPLTLEPHHNLPADVNLDNFKTDVLTSFYRTDVSFVRVFNDDRGFLVLYGCGRLIGRLPRRNEWVKLCGKIFDDIVVFRYKFHAVDKFGKLSSVNVNYSRNTWRLGKLVVSCSKIFNLWRKRLVVDGTHLYLVVRTDDKMFSVYKMIALDKSVWSQVRKFDGGKVLFVSKDCCFFMSGFGGRKYRNCIVFTEAGFPLREYDCRRDVSECEDEIWVFRMSDKSYGKVGESIDFPEIDWSPPSWIFDGGSCSSSHSRSHSEGESDEEDGEVQSDSNDSNTEDEDEQEVMLLDSNSDQEHEERVDSEIQSNANIEGEASLLEDVPPSLLADVSVVEEEVKRTLLRMSGGNEAIDNESSRVNITFSAPRACTSSANKRPKIDTATAKFEGFDIRSDLVPILQKIWRNHGNIIENSTMRSADIITRALESLATVVQILENTSVQSLSDYEADYLSSTLSDLKFMGFKVHWLVSCVEKAVKLQKSKTLVDCLNKLTQLSHQVKDRRAVLLDEVIKLNEEENKLTKEMAKVSKLIPFYRQVKLDEPLGVGLT